MLIKIKGGKKNLSNKSYEFVIRNNQQSIFCVNLLKFANIVTAQFHCFLKVIRLIISAMTLYIQRACANV